MKLVNTRTGQPLVTMEQGMPMQFHHDMLARAMEAFGVDIPVYLRGQFHNKTHIFPNDPDFSRAFREVYYTHTMDRDLYKWVE